MNTLSNSHKRFSEYLNNPRVLTNPEEFLGPNFEEVLNFWMILEELSEEQWRVVKERYLAFRDENILEGLKAENLAWDTSQEVVGEDYANYAFWAVGEVIKYWAADYASGELIAMHKILENHQQPLTFLPMFLDF